MLAKNLSPLELAMGAEVIFHLVPSDANLLGKALESTKEEVCKLFGPDSSYLVSLIQSVTLFSTVFTVHYHHTSASEREISSPS